MDTCAAALDLLYPASKSTLMQHLQTLVLRGNPYWVGGISHPGKLKRLVLKLAERYAVLRNERGRTYDRSIGRATVHLVVYPSRDGIAWWLLSSEGKGGLADPASPDFKAAKNALASDGHIEFEDYVLLYAHKKDPRTVRDEKTGLEKRIMKSVSTWTWKMKHQAFNEVKAKLDAEVKAVNLGTEPVMVVQGEVRQVSMAPTGVRGLLHLQRQRPLFSGVRTQVVELHKSAHREWEPKVKTWRARNPRHAALSETIGHLTPVSVVARLLLPKMRRLQVFADPSRTIRSLTG